MNCYSSLELAKTAKRLKNLRGKNHRPDHAQPLLLAAFPWGRRVRRTNHIPTMRRWSNRLRPLVITLAAVAALTAAGSTSASPTARRWYWTERYTATQIYLTDAQDQQDRQPAAIFRGGYISDKIDCTGLPAGIRRKGLRLYWHLDCSFRVTETDLDGNEIDTYWSGVIIPRGREDYLARWRRYA